MNVRYSYIALILSCLLLFSIIAIIPFIDATNRNETRLSLNFYRSDVIISNVIEGESILFKGKLTLEDLTTPVAFKTIQIKYFITTMNQIHDKSLVVTSTDIHGNFESEWTANSNITNSEGLVYFYADFDGDTSHKQITSNYNSQLLFLEIFKDTSPKFTLEPTKSQYYPGDLLSFSGICKNCPSINTILYGQNGIIKLSSTNIITNTITHEFSGDFGTLPLYDSSLYSYGILNIKSSVTSNGVDIESEVSFKFLPNNPIATAVKLSTDDDLIMKEGIYVSFEGTLVRDAQGSTDVLWILDSLDNQEIVLNANVCNPTCITVIIDRTIIEDGAFAFEWKSECILNDCTVDLFASHLENDIFAEDQSSSSVFQILSYKSPEIFAEDQISHNSELSFSINTEPLADVKIELTNPFGFEVATINLTSDSNGIVFVNGNDFWISSNSCTKSSPYGSYTITTSIPTTTNADKTLQTSHHILFVNENNVIPDTHLEILDISQTVEGNFFRVFVDLSVTGNLCSFDKVLIGLDSPIDVNNLNSPNVKVFDGFEENIPPVEFNHTSEWVFINPGTFTFHVGLIDSAGNLLNIPINSTFIISPPVLPDDIPEEEEENIPDIIIVDIRKENPVDPEISEEEEQIIEIEIPEFEVERIDSPIAEPEIVENNTQTSIDPVPIIITLSIIFGISLSMLLIKIINSRIIL